jgi:hypothetical protein
MPPQKFKVGIVEERTGIGSALTAMDTGVVELQTEIRQSAFCGIWIFRADEYVI